jgi:hypothetical protein
MAPELKSSQTYLKFEGASFQRDCITGCPSPESG